MAVVSQNFPSVSSDLWLRAILAKRTETAPIGSPEQDLSQLESQLQEICRTVESYNFYNTFRSELRVWAINFLYYLTLDTPKEGLKTYIPLLQEILCKNTDKYDPAAAMMRAWLKNYNSHSHVSGEVVLAALATRSPLKASGIYFRNYTPLNREWWYSPGTMFSEPSEQNFLQLWQLRNQVTTVDLLAPKMGKTSRAIQEHIFSFLDSIDLQKVMAVSKDCFTRCQGKRVFSAVYLPKFKQSHPELFKRNYAADLNEEAEKLKTLVNQILNSRAALAAVTNRIDLISRIAPFRMDLHHLKEHLIQAQKRFPYEMLLFRATTQTSDGGKHTE